MRELDKQSLALVAGAYGPTPEQGHLLGLFNLAVVGGALFILAVTDGYITHYNDPLTQQCIPIGNWVDEIFS